MSLETLIGTFVSIFKDVDITKIIPNLKEILDIIMASLKQYFGKAEETEQA